MMDKYTCDHQPQHSTHIHQESDEQNISEWEYHFDCEPVCGVPEEDWRIPVTINIKQKNVKRVISENWDG